MSYILEALKKAERQRRLGQAPDIYAPAIADAAAAGAGGRAKGNRWPFAAALLAAGASVWFGLWNAEPHQPAKPAPDSAASHAVQNMQAPPASAAPGSALAAPPISEPSDPSEASARKPAERAQASQRPPAPRPKTMQKEAQKKTHAAPKPAGKPKTGKPAGDTAHAGRRASAAAPSAEEAHLPTQHELPENLRQQIPAMAVNGYIYANNPADRSIVINNRVLHEGEQLMPGLVLEKMKPKEAIMNYKGFRYRLLY